MNKSQKRGDRKSRFLVSVFQSVVFNSYLNKRIEKDLLSKAMIGDVVRIMDKIVVLKENFEKDMKNEDQPVITGPIIGSKMALPLGEPLMLEKSIVESFGIEFDEIYLSRAKGSRRDCVVKPQQTKASPISDKQVELSFFLQKGSYATTLLSEIGIEFSA
ncbi:MAG: tRNA pseudouridine(13) synthase TruD [Acidobacteria bacterium]|nr:tRNA pseudouridine(13) synthase TruD [Acidobacteriota bacterium]